MRTRLSFAERDRRWSLLQLARQRAGYDALVLVGGEDRNERGALRYVADHDPRWGDAYAVLPGDGDPVVVLSASAVPAARRGWVTDVRVAEPAVSTVVDVLRGHRAPDRVGVVGLDAVLRVRDHRLLRAALPDTAFEDATALFDATRAVKSDEEIAGLQESAYIADRCLERLLEVARPGATEREIGAEVARVGASLGASDAVHRCLHQATGAPGAELDLPGDRVLHPNDVFTMSVEVCGPTGYWAAVCRPVAFAPLGELAERVTRAAASAVEATLRRLVPGTSVCDAHGIVADTAASEGTTPIAPSGHGTGLDRVEPPMVGPGGGDGAVAGASDDPLARLVAGTAIVCRPMVADDAAGAVALAADTIVVEREAARRLSEYPLGVFHPHHWLRRP